MTRRATKNKPNIGRHQVSAACRSAALIIALIVCFLPIAGATVVRIKDLATVYGTAGHKLIGYGLVVGLEGTGDSRRTLFTAQSLANMLEQFGVTVPAAAIRADNVAAVMVTAELPPEAKPGTKIDVTVSSIGDAESLQGGTLLVTPLRAADGEIYAIAQGPVSIGGFNVAAGGSKVQKNHPVVGRVPNGGQIVRELHASIAADSRITIILHTPDFTTAVRIAEAINSHMGWHIARPISQAVVEVAVPDQWAGDVVRFVSYVESIPVQPDVPARVVINERTGTVIIGGNVRILPVAIAHGGLTIEIKTRWEVSQPPPLVQTSTQNAVNVQVQNSGQNQPPNALKPPDSVPNSPSPAPINSQSAPTTPKNQTTASQKVAQQPNSQAAASTLSASSANAASGPPSPRSPTPSRPSAQKAPRIGEFGTESAVIPPTGGTTVVVPQTKIKAKETQGRLFEIEEQAKLKDLVEALNALGVTPRDLIAIIQALKEMGALQAELVIQ